MTKRREKEQESEFGSFSLEEEYNLPVTISSSSEDQGSKSPPLSESESESEPEQEEETESSPFRLHRHCDVLNFHELCIFSHQIKEHVIISNVDTNGIELWHRRNGESGGRYPWNALHKKLNAESQGLQINETTWN